MKKLIAIAAFGWFVVTYSGQPVAGPFDILSECQDMAKIMAKRYYNVATVCQYRD